MLLAPWNHCVLDRALLQMVQDLVAGDTAVADDLPGFVQIRHVEVAHAPGQDLALALKLLESRERVLERILAAPVQEIAVEAIGLQPSQRSFAGQHRSLARRILGENLGYEEHFIPPPGDNLCYHT